MLQSFPVLSVSSNLCPVLVPSVPYDPDFLVSVRPWWGGSDLTGRRIPALLLLYPCDSDFHLSFESWADLQILAENLLSQLKVPA